MTGFPAALDTFVNLDAPELGKTPNLVNAVANLNDAMEAVQSKIGITPDGRTLFNLAGAPVNETVAALSTALAGNNNDLDYTSLLYGADGNAITITYIDPGENDVALGVEVSGTDILVTLATDSGGVITTTAGDIITAIEAHAEADALVSVANKAGNDGTGLVIAMAEDALEGGVDASKRDLAPAGSLLLDTTNFLLYYNGGTQAEPVWTLYAAKPFHVTVTLTSAAAATPVPILADAAVPAGMKVYLQGYVAKVDGATDWATTATITIQDTNGTPVVFVTLTASALDGNEVHGPWSDSATLGDAFAEGTGGTAAKGLVVVGNANGTGSDLKLTVWGVIK